MIRPPALLLNTHSSSGGDVTGVSSTRYSVRLGHWKGPGNVPLMLADWTAKLRRDAQALK